MTTKEIMTTTSRIAICAISVLCVAGILAAQGFIIPPPADPSLAKLSGFYNFTIVAYGPDGKVESKIGTMYFDGSGNLQISDPTYPDPIVGPGTGRDYTVKTDTCSGTLTFRLHATQSRFPISSSLIFVADPDYKTLAIAQASTGDAAVVGKAWKIR